MSSYLRLRHNRSMNTLSIHRPRPSIEMRIPAAASVPVKAALVNWLPWSVLKISGLPKRASASSSAEMQNDTSMVFDNRMGRNDHQRSRQQITQAQGAEHDDQCRVDENCSSTL